MCLEKSFGRVADRIDGLRVWFRTFEELVAKKIQYGDLDEVKLLFQRRGQGFRREKIVRFLNPQQKTKLEQLLKDTKRGRWPRGTPSSLQPPSVHN